MATVKKTIISDNSPKNKKKRLQINLMFKITLLISISIILVAVTTSAFIYKLGYDSLENEVRNNLILLAANTAVSIDGDKLNSINIEKDENTKEYKDLQFNLQEIQKTSNEKLKFVYIIGKRGNDYVYLVDAVPIGNEDHSTTGEVFPMEDYPESFNGFLYPTADREILPDVEVPGVLSQSGYAPIMDSYGKIVGMVGIDMDVSVLNEKKNAMIKTGIISLAIAFILAILLGISFSKYLTSPILKLIKVTRKVAKGNLDALVKIKRSDEFGELGNAFNMMTNDLKIYNEKLKKYNLELENKVEQRTKELSQINKEIKDILDNISQAIFTIGPDLKFNPQHSQYAFDIFGDITFTDRNILDVLFQDNKNSKYRENMITWFNRIFSNDFNSWEDISELQPVREIAINTNINGKEYTKYIEVEFEAIFDSTTSNDKLSVSKIMVIIQDITDKKSLELKMEIKEQEYKDNINQIVEMINMDQELFQDFISECKDSLTYFEPQLIELRNDKENIEIVNSLFRTMHTIKGNAKAFNLERISGEAHSIENIFDGIRKGKSIMTDTLLDDVFKKLDNFNAMFNEVLNIYEKIVNGKSIDNESKHTKAPIENDIIRVKLYEINKLVELIKGVSQLIQNDIANNETSNIDKNKVYEVRSIIEETENQIYKICKVEINRLFNRFPRMVRDISIELGKKAKLTIKGDHHMIDKNIFDQIADPLIHIIRNSIDHGLESPEERLKYGKPEEGTIEIVTDINDNEILLEIKDDGKGLNIDKIKARAVKNEIISADEALNMNEDEASNLIFMPGFSTSKDVTDLSGRGVGMDVVKNIIEKNLNGKVKIKSNKNTGLSIKLQIPLINYCKTI